MASKFHDLPKTKPDPAFSLVEAYAKDQATEKANLCPGFYRDENALPWILPCVAEAEKLIFNNPEIDHEHLPLLGHPEFVRGAQRLLFADDTHNLDRIASIQTVSGTGANYLGARFLSVNMRPRRVWISNPSWILHGDVWEAVDASIERRFYPYYDNCAHNPTGKDLSQDQWIQIADLCEEKSLFPFFDTAYQGFATGNLYDDAWAVRYFFERNRFDFAVAQSFSKNFGLYGERIGALHIVMVDGTGELSFRVSAQLAKLQRCQITSAPSYGARIVATILNEPALYSQWLGDLNTMCQRMKRMRERLHEELLRHDAPGSWDHILSETGMFTMSSMTKEQVSSLISNYHVYLLPSGRISVTGLTDGNVAYVARSIAAVLQQSV